MSKDTIQFLLNLLGQVSIKAGQDDFDQAYGLIAKAKAELKAALAERHE